MIFQASANDTTIDTNERPFYIYFSLFSCKFQKESSTFGSPVDAHTEQTKKRCAEIVNFTINTGKQWSARISTCH